MGAHTVEVLVPPRVKPRPEDGNIVVKKGTEVTLECSASGNPVPEIAWNRENDHLPEGHKPSFTTKRLSFWQIWPMMPSMNAWYRPKISMVGAKLREYIDSSHTQMHLLNLQPVTWDGLVVPQNQIQNFHFYSVYSAAW